MKTLLKNKTIGWLIVLLMLANVGSLTFYWVSNFFARRDNSPKEFLAKKLNFGKNQKDQYFELAHEHNQSAEKIRSQIKMNKEAFFKLLKSDVIIDSTRNNAALQVSLSIQSLDILTFEHFKKVRDLCTEEQKLKFDELIQKMVNSVNNPQQGPPPPIKEDILQRERK